VAAWKATDIKTVVVEYVKEGLWSGYLKGLRSAEGVIAEPATQPN
jgi:hypothetical protein